MDLYTLQVLLNVFQLAQIAMCLSKSSCMSLKIAFCLNGVRPGFTRSHGVDLTGPHIILWCEVPPPSFLIGKLKNAGLVIWSSQPLQQADQKDFLTKASVVTEFPEFHWMSQICRIVFFMSLKQNQKETYLELLSGQGSWFLWPVVFAITL